MPRWTDLVARVSNHALHMIRWWDRIETPPDTFSSSIPVYMRIAHKYELNGISEDQIFLIAERNRRPPIPVPADEKYGFHLLKFHPNPGFEWKGGIDDSDYNPDTHKIRQVAIKALAFILFENRNDPSQNGVRVYNAVGDDPMFLGLIHENENILSL